MYWRAAEYFADLDSPGHDQLGQASRESFLAMAALVDPPVSAMSVPYDHANLPLPGYFAPAPGSKGPNRTLIIMGGFDSSAEELYFGQGVEALKRGWHVFCFDGPGQTGMMRLRPRLPFRPDYEAVLTPVVDHLLARPEVDPGRLALLGISFGGYLASRAVSREKRVKA